jgi:hypothetical protein
VPIFAELFVPIFAELFVPIFADLFVPIFAELFVPIFAELFVPICAERGNSSVCRRLCFSAIVFQNLEPQTRFYTFTNGSSEKTLFSRVLSTVETVFCLLVNLNALTQYLTRLVQRSRLLDLNCTPYTPWA